MIIVYLSDPGLKPKQCEAKTLEEVKRIAKESSYTTLFCYENNRTLMTGFREPGEDWEFQVPERILSGQATH